MTRPLLTDAGHAPLPPLLRGDELTVFRAALLDFFRSARREFPWREDPHPYGILVSEVMLQQTRVDTVVPYYLEWMRLFPNLQALNSAEPDEILRVWQGLGYYSRALRLHRAVREVSERYGGRIPSDPAELESLPGIGPYTAGAVASIAFGVAAPAVDGNVRRVLARLVDEACPHPRSQRALAAALVDPEEPGAFNQGMMELGSLVCTPRAPRCSDCPVSRHCAARAAGTQLERPAPVVKRPIRREIQAVAVLVRRESNHPEVLLRRRPRGGLLGGMWEFPGVTVGARQDARRAATELALRLCPGSRVESGSGSAAAETLLQPVEHLFSHLGIRYLPFVIPLSGPPAPLPPSPSLRWIRSGDEGGVPLPVAQQKIWAMLTSVLAPSGNPVRVRDAHQE